MTVLYLIERGRIHFWQVRGHERNSRKSSGARIEKSSLGILLKMDSDEKADF
jgi:hypothetical protein